MELHNAGVSIGVLSNGVDSLAALQASGDLPAVTVISGQGGSGDEGSAMLEIVFDLAPGAQLFFATANGGPAQFAQNIRDLRTAGCDIIVDDVFYFVESVFQDGQTGSVSSNTDGGVITQAVNDVTADGALFFSSAGNEGNLNDNQSGTWEGDFVDGGALSALSGGTVHDFGGGNLGNTINAIGMGGGNPLPASLFWADPLGGSSNDYDLFLLNAALDTVIAASTNTQSGSQDPFEQIAGASLLTGARLVIFKDSGAANRFVHLRTNRGRLSVRTAASTKGHSTAADAFGVAAVNVATAGGGAFTGGVANPVETFSSDGPRHLFFNPDSSAITPGDFSSTGGLVRQKPDVAAADGVSCAAPGFNPFFGTSAAAPHAAAVAGLLKSLKPAATNAEIRAALTSSALDIEGAGVDRDSGAGIVMAYQGLAAISSADLSIVKTDSPDPVVAGTDLTYSITVTNNGGDRAVDLVMSDSLPAGTTFVSFTAPAGWTSTTPSAGSNGTVTARKETLDNAQVAVFSLVVHVSPSTPDGTMLSNTATVTSPVTDPNTGNNSSTATTAVVARADLAVTKSDSPDPVIAGTDLTYSITLINNGPSDAQNVSLSDTLPANTRFQSFTAPAGWTTVTPPVGGSGTVTATRPTLAFGTPSQGFTLVVRVCPEVLCNATVSNTASGSATTIDPDPSNNSPTATTSVRTQSDLSITKSAAPIAVSGCTAVFTITVSNAGPSNSAGTTVIDTLPANWKVVSITSSQGSSSGLGSGVATCNLGTLGAPNQCSAGAATMATITIVAQIPANQPPGTVTNTATVSSGNCLADPNPTDNTASVSVTVFDIFMQAFVNGGFQSLIFRSDTADYIFCRSDGFKMCGQGRITKHGCNLTMIEGLPERDRRVAVSIDTCSKKGVASLQTNPGATVVQITDKNTTDNDCDFACTACP
jgi:uncharacterized repeat protein (TIGR01451 family)